MNRYIIIALIFINIGCKTDKKQSIKNGELALVEKPKPVNDSIKGTNELYTLQFKIDTTENNTPNLVVDIKLHNNSYFVSPNANGDFKGKFYMDLGSYTHLNFKGDMIETPRSVEEIDFHPFVNGAVNWVRVNTTYKQPLNMKLKEDFVVFGRVRFTIEPRCTLEEIPFGISYKNGVLTLIESKC